MSRAPRRSSLGVPDQLDNSPASNPDTTDFRFWEKLGGDSRRSSLVKSVHNHLEDNSDLPSSASGSWYKKLPPDSSFPVARTSRVHDITREVSTSSESEENESVPDNPLKRKFVYKRDTSKFDGVDLESVPASQARQVAKNVSVSSSSSDDENVENYKRERLFAKRRKIRSRFSEVLDNLMVEKQYSAAQKSLSNDLSGLGVNVKEADKLFGGPRLHGRNYSEAFSDIVHSHHRASNKFDPTQSGNKSSLSDTVYKSKKDRFFVRPQAGRKYSEAFASSSKITAEHSRSINKEDDNSSLQTHRSVSQPELQNRLFLRPPRTNQKYSEAFMSPPKITVENSPSINKEDNNSSLQTHVLQPEVQNKGFERSLRALRTERKYSEAFASRNSTHSDKVTPDVLSVKHNETFQPDGEVNLGPPKQFNRQGGTSRKYSEAFAGESESLKIKRSNVSNRSINKFLNAKEMSSTVSSLSSLSGHIESRQVPFFKGPTNGSSVSDRSNTSSPGRSQKSRDYRLSKGSSFSETDNLTENFLGVIPSSTRLDAFDRTAGWNIKTPKSVRRSNSKSPNLPDISEEMKNMEIEEAGVRPVSRASKNKSSFSDVTKRDVAEGNDDGISATSLNIQLDRSKTASITRKSVKSALSSVGTQNFSLDPRYSRPPINKIEDQRNESEGDDIFVPESTLKRVSKETSASLKRTSDEDDINRISRVSENETQPTLSEHEASDLAIVNEIIRGFSQKNSSGKPNVNSLSSQSGRLKKSLKARDFLSERTNEVYKGHGSHENELNQSRKDRHHKSMRVISSSSDDDQSSRSVGKSKARTVTRTFERTAEPATDSEKVSSPEKVVGAFETTSEAARYIPVSSEDEENVPKLTSKENARTSNADSEIALSSKRTSKPANDSMKVSTSERVTRASKTTSKAARYIPVSSEDEENVSESRQDTALSSKRSKRTSKLPNDLMKLSTPKRVTRASKMMSETARRLPVSSEDEENVPKLDENLPKLKSKEDTGTSNSETALSSKRASRRTLKPATDPMEVSTPKKFTRASKTMSETAGRLPFSSEDEENAPKLDKNFSKLTPKIYTRTSETTSSSKRGFKRTSKPATDSMKVLTPKRVTRVSKIMSETVGRLPFSSEDEENAPKLDKNFSKLTPKIDIRTSETVSETTSSSKRGSKRTSKPTTDSMKVPTPKRVTRVSKIMSETAGRLPVSSEENVPKLNEKLTPRIATRTSETTSSSKRGSKRTSKPVTDSMKVSTPKRVTRTSKMMSETTGHLPVSSEDEDVQKLDKSLSKSTSKKDTRTSRTVTEIASSSERRSETANKRHKENETSSSIQSNTSGRNLRKKDISMSYREIIEPDSDSEEETESENVPKLDKNLSNLTSKKDMRISEAFSETSSSSSKRTLKTPHKGQEEIATSDSMKASTPNNTSGIALEGKDILMSYRKIIDSEEENGTNLSVSPESGHGVPLSTIMEFSNENDQSTNSRSVFLSRNIKESKNKLEKSDSSFGFAKKRKTVQTRPVTTKTKRLQQVLDNLVKKKTLLSDVNAPKISGDDLKIVAASEDRRSTHLSLEKDSISITNEKIASAAKKKRTSVQTRSPSPPLINPDEENVSTLSSTSVRALREKNSSISYREMIESDSDSEVRDESENVRDSPVPKRSIGISEPISKKPSVAKDKSSSAAGIITSSIGRNSNRPSAILNEENRPEQDNSPKSVPERSNVRQSAAFKPKSIANTKLQPITKFFSRADKPKLMSQPTVQKKTARRPIPEAKIIDGKVYKPKPLARPKNWATDSLYKHIQSKLQPNHSNLINESEKLVTFLAAMYDPIMKSKTYAEHTVDLIFQKLKESGVVTCRYDFFLFCHNFMPIDFRKKVVPRTVAGSKEPSLPFDPKTAFKTD